jgi:YesN/AraC family two-component response regulator
MPDIIISDIMMPVMDGFAFLQKLKSDIRTSHIPVILLTAKADAESKLEGLEYGAEAYLTKPFVKEELRIRLRKILELRMVLQKRYGSFEADLDMEAPAPVHDFFIAQVRETLKEHLDDEEFGIAELCRALGMSRSQLYRKFTALTNTTVSKYMRSYRLQRAMELLKKSDLNVSQVMLDVGLTNLSHFSRCFKEKFGVSPSKVRLEN